MPIPKWLFFQKARRSGQLLPPPLPAVWNVANGPKLLSTAIAACRGGHAHILAWLQQEARPGQQEAEEAARWEITVAGAGLTLYAAVRGCPLEAVQLVHRHRYHDGAASLGAGAKQSLAIGAAVSATADWELKLDWVLLAVRQPAPNAQLPGHPHPVWSGAVGLRDVDEDSDIEILGDEEENGAARSDASLSTLRRLREGHVAPIDLELLTEHYSVEVAEVYGVEALEGAVAAMQQIPRDSDGLHAWTSSPRPRAETPSPAGNRIFELCDQQQQAGQQVQQVGSGMQATAGMQATGGLSRQQLHRDASAAAPAVAPAPAAAEAPAGAPGTSAAAARAPGAAVGGAPAAGAAANAPRKRQQRDEQQQPGRPQEQQPGSEAAWDDVEDEEEPAKEEAAEEEEDEGIVQMHMYVVHPGDLNHHELAAELQLPRYMQLPDKRQLAYLPMADVQQRLCGRGVPPQAWRFFLLEPYKVERVKVDPAMSIRDFADQAAARLPPQHGYFRLSSCGIPSSCCMMAAALGMQLRDGKAALFGIGPPPPGVSTFTIAIKTLWGRSTELSGVYNNLIVSHLKDMVEQKTGLPSGQVTLTSGGMQLEDHRTLADYGIGPGTTVRVVLKLRGGKPVICVWAAQPTDVSVRLRLSRHWAFSSLVPRPDEYSGSGSSSSGGGISGGGEDTATEAEGGKGGWAAGGREAAWRVRALPDGTLAHPGSGGREYAYLFWEALTEGSAVAAAVAAEASGGVAGGGSRSSRGSSRRSSCSNGTMVWEEQPEQAQAGGDGQQLQLQPQGRPATATADATAPAPAAAAITSPSSRLAGLGPTPADLPLPDFQPTRSFCVAGADAEAWLYGALSAFGLPVRERTDFLTYWLPHMEGAAWLLISFADPADYEAAAALEVTPAPDVCVRLVMLFERLAAPVAGACGDLGAEAARVGVLRREGCSLAVLEWGGMEVVRAGGGRA
ncbi:hypothetical protein HXX76_015867 [Chlamydomonas incerta]|uniref:Ubiquitin-like domain-containing protein n=1 Tax=Chlamydomonas incerta TaxID=51695 RepID=A0A835SFZ3_CHLIN|nr:hypothetical protein HXX76_015867 [Chlamydomonas incerta]|eukprot:KAG2422703.1 hypothetical protein HXX76_015867 [Chlamydomonas incerta]